jgi:hypothetical protein
VSAVCAIAKIPCFHARHAIRYSQRKPEVPVRTRLFHTVVLVGTAMGASLSTVSCSGSDSGSGQCQGQSCGTFPGISFDGGSDTFPGIGYRGDTGSADSGQWDAISDARGDVDTGASDSGRWDSIADTWPGIHPADTGPDDTGTIDTGTDTFPGISPVIDSGTDT